MPLFLVERDFAERLDLSPEEVSAVTQAKLDLGANWLYSFLSADKKKTYCVYEASSVEVLLEVAKQLNVPIGEIVELSSMITPSQSESQNPAD